MVSEAALAGGRPTLSGSWRRSYLGRPPAPRDCATNCLCSAAAGGAPATLPARWRWRRGARENCLGTSLAVPFGALLLGTRCMPCAPVHFLQELLRWAEGHSLEELMAAAAALRDTAHPSAVTFSPKVFIPLTRLCRDSCVSHSCWLADCWFALRCSLTPVMGRPWDLTALRERAVQADEPTDAAGACSRSLPRSPVQGYCTFAQPPVPGRRAYMTLEEVLEVARLGAAQGCTEALFTLGALRHAALCRADAVAAAGDCCAGAAHKGGMQDHCRAVAEKLHLSWRRRGQAGAAVPGGCR